MEGDNILMPLLFTRTLRLKVRAEAYAWLNAAAVEVNEVFNYCNETSLKAATRTDKKQKWMSGFDLCNLSAGASEYFDKIGANTIQSICIHYAQKRQAARRLKLRWRVSRGPRRSLGWVPFKAASLKRKGVCVRLAGKCFRVFERERLDEVTWQGGCFAQDVLGDWWLCLPVKVQAEESVAPEEAVGIDLGLKDIATTSDGERLRAGRWTQAYAQRLALAQRRGHKRQANSEMVEVSYNQVVPQQMEGSLDDPRGAIRALDIVHAADPVLERRGLHPRGPARGLPHGRFAG